MAGHVRQFLEVNLVTTIAGATDADSKAIPCRNAKMVVFRLRSDAVESLANVPAASFAMPAGATLADPAVAGTGVSPAGQGYSSAGTMPVSLNQSQQAYAIFPTAPADRFFHDFVRFRIRGPLTGPFHLDAEVYYTSEDDWRRGAQVAVVPVA